jgi:hypothetical protein
MGPFTKDVRADEGVGVWKIRTNSDIGGRGVFSNPDVRNLKKFKNKLLFPLF